MLSKLNDIWTLFYYVPPAVASSNEADQSALGVFVEGLWGTWLCKNTLVLALVVGAIFAVWRMSKREYWRLAVRELLGRKIAVISFCVLCLYGGIALLDSLGWHHVVVDETGEVIRDSSGSLVRESRGMSAFDYLFQAVWVGEGVKKEQPGRIDFQEDSYSEPRAKVEYNSSTTVDEEGEKIKVHKDLKYPQKHLLGTDRVGQDVFYMSLKGIRTAIIIGVVATLLAIPFAILLGVLAGYFGGLIDDGIQYFYTVFASIPSVLLIVAFMMVWERGLLQLCVVMGITSWVTLCRVLRGETLKLREMEFVQSAKAMGVPPWRIMLRHILPNLMHVVLITAVLRFSGQVMNEAILTYLQLGVDPQTPSWGRMINSARMELARDPEIWWQILAAFVAMIGLLLPANLFGDALRDALDPRLRTQ